MRKLKLIGYVLICILLSACNFNNNTPVMFHIPENYSGRFVVVYEENCGIDPAQESDSLIYIIPDNGVLILRDKFESRILNHSYYLTNSSGRIEKLSVLLDYEDQFKSKWGVLCLGTGTIGGVSPDGIQAPKDATIKYEEYFVVNKDSSKISEEQFDSIMTKIVYDCRKGIK